MASTYKYWTYVGEIKEKSFTCWSCSKFVAGNRAYYNELRSQSTIYICPNCAVPNYFNSNEEQFPGPRHGNSVDALPEDIKQIYEESRSCFSVNSYTGSALLSRKILMNVAVSKGAEENKAFIYYVDWLLKNNYLPPDSQNWVDHIRKIGNQGTHEITSVTKEDAAELINFCEMILKFIFEFPARMNIKSIEKI